MKKGLNTTYGFMLENLPRRDVNMSIKDLKIICGLIYEYIIFCQEDVEEIIREYKKVHTKNIKQ